MIRKDILIRCTKIVDDRKPEAGLVLDNNMRILNLLSDAIRLADSSTQILDKSFGPSQPGDGRPPRIGNPD
jgi:hypothetical protein